MKLQQWLLLLLLGAAVVCTNANDAEGDDAAAAEGDDAAAAEGDDAANYDDDYAANYAGDDYIKYWTEYAILPKRCIV